MSVPARAGLAALLVAAATVASAQAFPAKPIRIIIPFAPGGATDVVFRMMGPRLTEQFGQPMVIENRPGGSTVIGMEQVARAAPDGYTLGVANLTFGLNPSLLPKLPYNTERDFAPVSLTAIVPLVLTVHPSLPVRSVKELIALARAKPGALNYASSGIASATHMASALFAHQAGIRMVHVPFTGGGPALTSALGGHVEVYVGSVPALVPHLKARKLIALGITTATRDPAIPEVPTIAEAGLPGYESREW
ncbi:MAG: tripartite tricarboxylate transporter substrate binding protein, partial [Proteobacteria bacterium]|nr:tripartite tricarboxylate transporter substrate binding protein [Burkholderiales bacterium]